MGDGEPRKYLERAEEGISGKEQGSCQSPELTIGCAELLENSALQCHLGS